MSTTEKLPMVIPADWVPGPPQGSWTYKDYASLPDDGHRYEIVNGVLYMAPAPSWSHQEIVGEFFAYLRDYLRATGLGGAFTSPIDVELAPENTFQPDVIVLLKAHRGRLKDRHIVGAPDLVIEVVSPGSATMDRHEKYVSYAQAGVPEYWIAEPGTQTVEVLVLKDKRYHSQGVFRGKAVLPSQVLPEFKVRVEQFFVSAWS